MEIPSRVENRFGEARASGDGITFQAGVNTGTININQRPRKTPFLKVAYGATCDAANKEHVPSCLPGTRVEVLKEIQEWIDGGNPKKLYWLNGMAGTGKSTIAMTLARTYKGMTGKNVRPEKNVCLGATFCFSRGGGDLASASRFAATVAIQLAEVSLQLRKLIENVLEDNPRLDSLSVQEQWDKLIIQPLSVFYQCTPTGSISLLFVIDALDECNNAEDVNVLIRCLERVTQIGGANCRVFLTSRPDQPIKAGLGNCVSGSRESFVLHDIEKSIVDQDLNLYYRDQLSRIRMIMSSENDIFSESLIANLVERSHGLFIHAATVCRFVQNGGFLAVERLNLLAKSEKADNAEKELDKMYTTVLEYSFVSASDGLCPEEAEKIHQLFQRIVGAIITISDAMNSESLALLLGEKRERIDTILSVLNSVINVEENNNELIRILHPSFREYLLDAKRCTNNSYSILADDTHGYILTRCFDLLMSQLQRNPLRITQPGAKARDAEIETINRYISIPLQYSSRYWWNHFQKSSDKWRNNVPLLEFLQDKYLYWLECLAWIAQLGQAVEAMLKLNTIFTTKLPPGKSSTSRVKRQKRKTESLLQLFLPDALRFLLSNRLTIEEAPLQLYVSALVFSPRHSEIRIKNYKEVPKWILNEPSTPNKWSDSSQRVSIPHSSWIYSLAVSSDSSLIATACSDCMVHIWDAMKGTEQLALAGNARGKASVSFSPDGCMVACLVDNTVSMWNVRAVLGRIPRPDFQLNLESSGFDNRWNDYPTCAYSPDGTLFAAVPPPDGTTFAADSSSPHDIWVWDMKFEGSVKFHLQGEPARKIAGLHFSSDGSLLISISISPGIGDDQNIDIWDTSTGIKLSGKARIPKERPVGFVSGTSYIMISPPFSKSKARLVLCDARTGSVHKSLPRGPDFPVIAMLRPEDGKLLFASYTWKGIFVWTPDEYRQPLLLKSRGSIFRRIVFSPNGRFIMESDEDNQLRIWNIEDIGSGSSRLAEMYRSIRNIGTNLGGLIRLASDTDANESDTALFLRSPDGNLLATFAKDWTITTLWDTATGKERFRLKTRRSLGDSVFSPASNVFAMLAETGIHFWDTETGRKGDILKKNDQRTFGYGHFQISPNGKKVIYVAHDTSAQSQPFCKCHIWEIDNLRRVSSSEIRFTFCERPQIALSPNEESYGIWSEASTVIEIRSFTNSQLQRRTLTRGVKLVKFTPDNKQVYILTAVSESQSTKSNNYIWDIQQDDLKEFGPERDVMAADTSQDGRLLALSFGSDSSTIEVYSVYSTALLHSIKLDFWNFSLQFSPSGTHFTTDRGTVMMPGESPPPSPQLFASESWIQENGQDILAMPSPYRGALIDIKGHTILFRDFPNEPVIVRLDQGCKSMTS